MLLLIKKHVFVITILTILGDSFEISNAIDSAFTVEDNSVTLGCNKQLYTYEIIQTDLKGRECKDRVSVWSCRGRCDSNEISDWKFPYKRSYHPVCVHAGRTKAVAYLRYCHPLADPETRRYEYMEATDCRCQTCSTMDTSCEAPHYGRDSSSVKILALAGPTGDELEY